MRIKDIVSISGLGGLYKIETQKVNGIIVTSLTEGWTKFISNRQHLFSPLESISIYKSDENAELADVLIEVHKQKDTHPPVDANADHKGLREWFDKIVPDHDHDKVYTSDIKKLIKWYEILDEKGVIEDEIKAREEEKKTEGENEDKTEEDENLKDEDTMETEIASEDTDQIKE